MSEWRRLAGTFEWRRLARILEWRRLAAMAGLAAGVAACEPLHSVFSNDDTTGSISARYDAGGVTTTDLAVARAAAAALLDTDGVASGPWDNPLTGARGTITPLALAYRDGNAECRDFLASYVRAQAEAWLQGEACRDNGGRWQVRTIIPWRRS